MNVIEELSTTEQALETQEEVKELFAKISDLLNKENVSYEVGMTAMILLASEGFQGTDEQWAEGCIELRRIMLSMPQVSPDDLH